MEQESDELPLSQVGAVVFKLKIILTPYFYNSANF